MMTGEQFPEHIRPGSTFEIGSFQFLPEDIIRFAKAWDPQIFHTDAEKAEKSLLGGLCASGWHTASIWMRLQRDSVAERNAELIENGLPYPEFGPSPGMKNLKWLRPVYAGDTITYRNVIVDLRNSGSKPGWHIMSNHVEATNQNGELAMSFDSAVFLRIVT